MHIQDFAATVETMRRHQRAGLSLDDKVRERRKRLEEQVDTMCREVLADQSEDRPRQTLDSVED